MSLNDVLLASLVGLAKEIKCPAPKVVNEGVGFEYEVRRRDNGLLYIAPLAGEQYRIDCPYCTDDRARLYVHHRFGTNSPDPRILGPMYDLVFCQNEQEKKPGFYSLLKDYKDALEHGIVSLEKVVSSSVSRNPLDQEPPSMGETVLLNSDKDSEHCSYWSSRGYDVDYLSKVFKACVCVNHEESYFYNNLKDRVIFPFFYDGRVVYWQARLSYECSKKFPPKWWFPPGTKKVLWNMDLAREYDYCILNEGISSAICAGPAAMAVGGKTLNSNMVEFIKNNFKGVFVMLDPDAGSSRSKGDPDYQARAETMLQKAGLEVYGVQWDEGEMRDPGDLGPKGCIEYIKKSSSVFSQKVKYICQ